MKILLTILIATLLFSCENIDTLPEEEEEPPKRAPTPTPQPTPAPTPTPQPALTPKPAPITYWPNGNFKTYTVPIRWCYKG